MPAAALDRSSPLPLWAQIADDLRQRMAIGEFEDRFPTDEDLTRTYEVSRHTAREAVRRLTGDGLLVRRRGQGTSLATPVIEQTLNSLYSLASSMRAQGIHERSQVLTAARRPAPPEVAAQLGMGRSRAAVFIERLRFADDEPIAWDRSWLPADRAAALLGADLSGGGLYDALAARCGLRVTGGWERIRPVIPQANERELLALPADVAAFSIERLVHAGPSPIEWRQSLIRGDRYSLLAQWPSADQPASGASS